MTKCCDRSGELISQWLRGGVMGPVMAVGLIRVILISRAGERWGHQHTELQAHAMTSWSKFEATIFIEDASVLHRRDRSRHELEVQRLAG